MGRMEETTLLLSSISGKAIILEKKQRSCLKEAASLSEEGYRRADCSPPEHTRVTLAT
jgi:hypothetical protein